MPFIVPNQTSYVLERPIYTGTTWTRPADWITITDTTGEVQFLVSDLTIPSYRIQTIFSRTLGTQKIYIDWGDGTIDTITATTATATSHNYTSGGTPCSLGYNTWKVRVYGDAGTTITSVLHLLPPVYLNTTNLNPNIGLLEAVYGDGTITTAVGLFQTSATKPVAYYLTYCKLPSVMSGAGDIMSSAFVNSYALKKVVLPTSAPNNTSIASMFSTCYSLQSVVFPQDMTNITNMSAVFLNCFQLQSITLPPTLNQITNISQAFQSCYLLNDLEFLPALPLCSNYAGAFASMRSLISANLKRFLTTTASVNLSTAFANCYALEYVNLPPMTSGGSCIPSQMFQGCSNLKSFIAPTNFNPTTLNSMFNGCASLSSCILPASMPVCADLDNLFIGCFNLQSFTFPTTLAVGCNFGRPFSNCQSLSQITIPNSVSLSNFYLGFDGCINLMSITLPNTISGQMRQTFRGCSNLQSITLPTNTTNTNIEGMFNNCSVIQNVVFTGTSIATTTLAATFQGATNLQSVVFPVSATSLTNISGTFNSCINLKDATLPQTTGNITTYNSTFAGSYALRSVVLPTTQSTALTTTNSMFSNCFSLSGITNLDKLGDPSTGSTIYIDGTAMFYQNVNLPTIDLYCKFSKFEANSTSSAPSKLTSLRLRNNGAGQYGGTSPQINISFTSLGQAALVQVFNDLPSVVGKTINITSSTGAALLTPAERAIATGKGWTIVG